jgi:DNA-binding LytR/AlgR family response regulator
MNATALIAEDEPLLAQALAAELARAWPALRVLATVGDGASAVTQALALKPDVLFFDIRMPGQTGLEAAVELADEWPEGDNFPALVFVTAYDQYAVQAFEAQAVDYVLKPVQAARLQKTVAKLQQATGPARQGSVAATPWRPRWTNCATCWRVRPVHPLRRSPRSRSSRPAWARRSAWCRWTR